MTAILRLLYFCGSDQLTSENQVSTFAFHVGEKKNFLMFLSPWNVTDWKILCHMSFSWIKYTKQNALSLNQYNSNITNINCATTLQVCKEPEPSETRVSAPRTTLTDRRMSVVLWVVLKPLTCLQLLHKRNQYFLTSVNIGLSVLRFFLNLM